MGGRKGIRLVKKWGHGGGGQWLVWMEWRPAGWSECLPLLVFPCTIKSRSSPLAPAHPGGPGKRAVKRLWCGGGISSQICCCRPCFGDFLVFVLIQDELSCLAWWINDQRIAVESIQHNGVLRTQVVSRQTVCLPAQTVVSIRQILQQTNTAVITDQWLLITRMHIVEQGSAVTEKPERCTASRRTCQFILLQTNKVDDQLRRN